MVQDIIEVEKEFDVDAFTLYATLRTLSSGHYKYYLADTNECQLAPNSKTIWQ